MKVTVSAVTVILIMCAGQGILLSAALITSGIKKNKSNLFLGLILSVISIQLLDSWSMGVGYHNSVDAIPFWVLGSYLILPPALWLFVQLNTARNFKLKKIFLLLFLPALIETSFASFSFFIYRLTGVAYHLMNNKAWIAFTQILPAIWMMYILIGYGKSLYVFFYKRFGLSYSLHTLKLYSFFIVFFGLTLLWIAEVVIQVPVFFVTQSILIAFIFTLGYIGYFQPAFFEIPKNMESKPVDEVFSGYDDSRELKRINQLFDDENIYIRSRLSVEDVAVELRLPVRYVSYLINNYHKSNFTNFVNTYRVKEVLRKLQDPKEGHKKLLAIALECGFSSKSSFNQIFKASTGKTPSSLYKRLAIVPKS